MTDELWGYIALSADIAKPYDRPLPEQSAVAFGITREGIHKLRFYLNELEQSMDTAEVARAHTPTPEEAGP